MDLKIHNCGSIILVTPVSKTGTDWIDEHIPAGTRWGRCSVAVEPRYVDDIIEGATNDGLTVS